MWVAPEQVDPVLLHAATRKSIAAFGAVRVADGCLLTRREKKFNAASFLPFLRQLLRHRRRGRKMVVILDNACWHRTRHLNAWLQRHVETLALDFLPPYSPQLNVIERVWELTRRLCTHNRCFPQLEELVEVVFEQFDAWRKPNNTLARLCAVT